MAIDYAVLKTELNTDPNTYGYAAMIAAGNHTGLAALLNLVRAEISIARGSIPVEEVKEAFVPTDFAGLTATQLSALLITLSGQTVNTESTNLRTILSNIFPAGSATRTNLVAIATRPGSRAEQLFGRGTTIAHGDVTTALNS